MASQFLFLSSSIVFLLFSLSSIYYICDAHYSPRTVKLPSPLHFQKNLNGTQKKGDRERGLRELKQYLGKLGYMGKLRQHNNYFDDKLESAIVKYQQFYNLNVTGTLDRETLELLSRSRCVAPDFDSRAPHSNIRENLVYYSYSDDFRQDAHAPIKKAMETWESRTPFKFAVRNDSKYAATEFFFMSRDVNNFGPFVRPHFPILKVIFKPPKIEFNSDMTWQTHGPTHARLGVYDLETSALHAVGHMLGLGHSSNPNAVMYPLLPVGEMKRQLSDDDIQAFNALHNKPS